MKPPELIAVTLKQALRMIGDALERGDYPEARAILRDVIASLQTELLLARAYASSKARMTAKMRDTT